MVDYLSIGRITKPHGVRGFLRVRPEINPPERISVFRSVYSYPGPEPDSGGADWTVHEIETVRVSGEWALVKFAGVDSRDAAEGLRDRYLFIPADDLPSLPPDNYSVYHLCQMSVVTESGEPVGRVADVLEMPAQPVLVVEGSPGGEIMIPFIKSIVKRVDMEKLEITVVSLPGLLEPT